MQKKNSSFLIALLFVAALIGVLLMNIWQVFQLTSSLTRSSGQYHLESITGELEGTISEAEQLAMNLAISAGPNLEDQEKLRDFVYTQKAEVLAQNNGCFNVYMAGTGWSIIPDFDMPEDYVATERDWYKGAKLSQGSTYVTAPYLDAMTGNICYSVSVMLGDQDTVLALDYTLDNIQSHIVQMYESGSQMALIVTGDGIIAGSSDERMIGLHLADVLPEYSSVFSLVKSRGSFVTTRIKADILYDNLFATSSGFGWYLIVSESDWNLYGTAYLQLIASALLALLLMGINVAVLLISRRRQRTAQMQMAQRDQLLSQISGELIGPINALLDNEDQEESGAQSGETLLRLRTSLRQILKTLQDADAEAERTRKPKKEKKSKTDELKMNARFRTRILLMMVLVVVISSASHLWIALRWSNEKLRSEVNSYDHTVTEWVREQKGILDMFCSIVSTNPEMLDNYDQTIAFLDRITQQYPEISATYMANPELNPTVYMNNGYIPPEGWMVEERDWWIDTMNSEGGWTISAPYYDVRTGLYCVTFAERVYDSETGEFLGNFGIDFIMDKLIDILGGSYSDVGYAFLADTDGIILNHPYGEYQMKEDKATNVSEVPYGQVKTNGTSSITIRDYDGTYRIVTAKRNAESGFVVYEVVNFADIYAGTFFSELLVLLVLLLCAIMVYRLLTDLLLWQDEMNERMQAAADTAIAAGKAKSRFLAQMSHEIRTPINAVLGMNEMILRETDNKTILDYASNIQIAGKTLLSLINSILDFSKIEEGKMEIVPVEYDTTSMLNNLVTSVSERAKKKGLELIVEVDSQLPARLIGDDVRVSQVILNLLTNAVKYTEKGSVRFSVRGGERREGSIQLLVSVADTGIGIREEDIPRLFESFERLDEVRNHNIEGTGLGMSIVLGLLRRMDSRLEVQSVYGEGSTFSFVILQRIADETPIGDYSQRLASSQAVVGTQTLLARDARVLVVDDNEMNLKVAKNLLKLFGIVPDLAFSGYEAVEYMGKNHYHLLLLDHMMPKMDGIETLKVLRRENLLPEDTVVVVLTANAVNGAREQYLAEGFDDYLSKPIDVGKLEEQLRRHLPPELCTTQEEASPPEPAQALSTEEPSDDALSTLERAGFDTESGLRYAAGDRDFYLELVTSFAQSAPSNREAIRDFWVQRAFGDYQIRVHALKSTARQIGANELSEQALAQEMAAKEGRFSDIDAGAEALLERYERTERELRDALGLDEARPQSAEVAAAEEASLSPQALRSALEEGKAYLDTFEVESAVSSLRPLMEYAPLRERVGAIVQALEEFDSFTAEELLDELLRELPEAEEETSK